MCISVYLFEVLGMFTKKKNALFGRYPACDFCNNALRFLLEGKTDVAFEEIVHAISSADGYFHEDIEKQIKERMKWDD